MNTYPSSIKDGDLRPYGQAAFAVVLYFDDVTELRVRRMWAALDRHGVASAATAHGSGFRPHVTLAIVETTRPVQVAGKLRTPLADIAGLPLTLGALGFFLTDLAPAYLAVAPTGRLLAVHEEVHTALEGTRGWNHYRPGTWMPHCTLAMGVSSPSAVGEALAGSPLPIQASVASAQLVQLPDPVGASTPAADMQLSLAPYPTLPAQHRAGPRHRGNRRMLQPLVTS